jgi:hypothetical protein
LEEGPGEGVGEIINFARIPLNLMKSTPNEKENNK